MRSWIEPISEQRARFVRQELHRHRDRRRTGHCRICRIPQCLGARQARAELLMAGRRMEPLTTWTLVRVWVGEFRRSWRSGQTAETSC